jgi:hypothetical protein
VTLNGKTLIEILPLKDLYTVYKDHHRLTVFANKGRKCVICDREGVLLLVREDKGDELHVDLYTDDFVLMTVDHIVPKKIARQMGWTFEQIEDLLNKQPMCDPCNGKKSDKLITNEQFKERRLKNGYPQKIKGVEIIRQLVHNEGIFSKSLEGVI